MTSARIILSPYHAGIPDLRVGKGPRRLMEDGLAARLQANGHNVDTIMIPPVEEWEGDIGRSFELKRRIAIEVAAAIAEGRFPIVLAGNCNSSIGVFAGLGDPGAGVVWFDAHPDFDTPDEHGSGYFDGMGVATLAGQCWKRLARSIPGFTPLDLSRLIYCGIRDFEPGQAEKVVAAEIAAVFGSTERQVDFPGGLAKALGTTALDRAHIHLDLDCLDTSVGLANEYAAPGGLSSDDLGQCFALLCREVRPLALTIASFNPEFEGAGAISEAGISVAVAIAAAA